MLKNFDSPDVYMLAGFYFYHVNSCYIGAFCIVLAILDAYVLNQEEMKGK